jgi:hypothetical protein
MSIVLKNQEMVTHVQNDDIQAKIIKAAKSSFCKRMRTLYRCMFPNILKQQMDKRVLAAWDSSPQIQNDFYILEVLGTSGIKPSALIINPRLEVVPGPARSSS